VIDEPSEKSTAMMPVEKCYESAGTELHRGLSPGQESTVVRNKLVRVMSVMVKYPVIVVLNLFEPESSVSSSTTEAASSQLRVSISSQNDEKNPDPES
jgi:hypothetical protein